MSRFIVFASCHVNECGGIQVLHKLAKSLNKLGQDSYICPCDMRIPQGFNMLEINGSTLISNLDIDKENDIVIYPEVIEGNPLEAKNCVRWILCEPGQQSADFSSSWGQNDFIAVYGTCHSQRYGSIDDCNQLFVVDIHQNWTEKSKQNRHATLLLTRKKEKFHQNAVDFHPEDALHLDKMCKTDEDYLVWYRRSSRLYSYDPYTFHNIISSLAGCLSIIYPVSGLSREDWIKTYPYYSIMPRINGHLFFPGIAYGEDEIELARQTASLLWPTILKLERFGELTVERFIEGALSHFNNISLTHSFSMPPSTSTYTL